jgi:cystathionine beta-lyase/cystathionine gamma-synthase
MDTFALEKAGISEGTVRLSVGLEDVEDLKEDLETGLKAAIKSI